MTRRAVLRGVDGVVFVADSDPHCGPSNQQSYLELESNLERAGRAIRDIAFVTQFNKRDLADALRPKAFGGEQVVLASAAGGTGVLDTFLLLAGEAWSCADNGNDLHHRFGISRDEFLDAVSLHLHL